MRRAVHVVITGRVQGVGFRAFVEREAEALRLSGWVRNRRDGTVEAVFAGDEGEIQHILMELNAGPPAAAVTSGPKTLPLRGRRGSPRKPVESVVAAVASARTRVITSAGASPAHGPGSPPLPWQSATAPATCGAAWLVPV